MRSSRISPNMPHGTSFHFSRNSLTFLSDFFKSFIRDSVFLVIPQKIVAENSFKALPGIHLENFLAISSEICRNAFCKFCRSSWQVSSGNYLYISPGGFSGILSWILSGISRNSSRKFSRHCSRSSSRRIPKKSLDISPGTINFCWDLLSYPFIDYVKNSSN